VRKKKKKLKEQGIKPRKYRVKTSEGKHGLS